MTFDQIKNLLSKDEAKKDRLRISLDEKMFLEPLLKKHGEDYVRMAKDVKLNKMQWNANQIQKKHEQYKKFLTMEAASWYLSQGLHVFLIECLHLFRIRQWWHCSLLCNTVESTHISVHEALFVIITPVGTFSPVKLAVFDHEGWSEAVTWIVMSVYLLPLCR